MLPKVILTPCFLGILLAISASTCAISTTTSSATTGAALPCTVQAATLNSTVSPPAGTSVPSGSRANYTCAPGNRVDGPSYLQCINGVWTGIPPYCVANVSDNYWILRNMYQPSKPLCPGPGLWTNDGNCYIYNPCSYSNTDEVWHVFEVDSTNGQYMLRSAKYSTTYLGAGSGWFDGKSYVYNLGAYPPSSHPPETRWTLEYQSNGQWRLREQRWGSYLCGSLTSDTDGFTRTALTSDSSRYPNTCNWWFDAF